MWHFPCFSVSPLFLFLEFASFPFLRGYECVLYWVPSFRLYYVAGMVQWGRERKLERNLLKKNDIDCRDEDECFVEF
jgi:hypothetical protein